MRESSKKFLYRLLSTPSPTGFEEEIQRVVKQHMQPYADSIESDLHGNLLVRLNTKAERTVMLAGHCDQIGFMVKHITNEGFIYVASLGGIDTGVLPGARVTIHAAKGKVPGVIGRKPIHKQRAEERGKVSLEIDHVWIDIGAKDKAQVEKLLALGDPVTFELGVQELQNDRITAAGLDDRVGLFVAMEALKLCRGKKLAVQLVAASTVQEEVGLRGAHTAAFTVAPEVGIAIDVTHANDNPGTEEKHSLPCKLGNGPSISRGPNVNPIVYRKLLEAAKQAKIPHQVAIDGRLFGNDANAIQISRGGVATASIGLPNRYMHTQAEVVSLKDLENSAKLLAKFVQNISTRSSFKPH